MKNNSKQPKMTVIIPTRERPDTLEKCLKTVVAQDYDNLEIIVSDNFSCDSTEDVVRSYNDMRITYLNTGKRLSMSHNWEFALSHVADGWVTILGDDDGLLPASLTKVAGIIESTDIQAIRSRECSYSWPSLTGKEFSLLVIPLQSNYEVRDSKTWLSRVLNGYAAYPELPMMYHGGFVSMSVLKEIKGRTGAFYRSCVPDVYSAIAISSVIKSYIYSHEPFAIDGVSGHSTGRSYFSGEKKSELSPAQKFRSEENIPYHKDIPLSADGDYPLSIQVIVYESFLQSMILRSDMQGNIHAQQLEVILATAGKHEAAVREWGKIFATMHGLNFESVQSNARRKRLLLKLYSAPRFVPGVINTYLVGSPEVPIKDVYDASIVASAIRNSTCRLKNIYRRASRTFKRITGA